MARSSTDQDSQGFDVRVELLKSLMAHVQDSTYPSNTQLDMIEELLTEKEEPAYLKMLLGFVDDARFPSVPMLARIKRFT
ncbi:hypothetical protein [Janibacter sp. DB-40]|uniref:hypothetical protein n=1 Tax=Janibacter sp. DB-40 TaxID=3028808 RepID=UPI0024072E43|nr:hypothetical protein [Janibacter sp. DB-40]